MTYWNHRVMKHVYPDKSEMYEFGEVFYNQRDRPHSYASFTVMWTTDEEAKWLLKQLKKATLKPVILVRKVKKRDGTFRHELIEEKKK